MNYSCGNDALSSSKLNELIHLNVSTPNKLYNGTMKNVTDQDSQSLESSNQLEKHIQLKSNLFQKVDECYELGLNNKKLKFSEKLKVLLKNGGNKSEKVDLNDPYTFSEIDSQYGIPSDQALCDVDSIVQKSSLPNVKSNNVPTQKSIIFPKSVVPKLLVNNAGVKNEFSSETKNNYTSMKLAKLSVPVYSSNNALVANQTSYKVSSSSTADKFKTVNSRNARAIASHFSANNRHFLEKAGSKPILQNVKPSTHLNNAVRVNKSVSGKPHSFGQTQLVRHAGAKPERKTEGKSKNFAKGKSLLNQLQKTVSLNKTIAKPRKIPSKAYITTGKSILAQSELPFSNNKNFNKRSLLEESLLGIKNNSTSKDSVNFSSLKQRPITADNGKYNHTNHTPIPKETASATVTIPSKLQSEILDHGKKESLQRIWNIRNKLNMLKRDHHHFGLSINDIDYDDASNSESLLFQNYWFSVSNDYDSLSYHDRRRDTKLSQLKIELRHKIKQLQWKYKDEYRDKVVELLVDSARKQPNLTAFLITLDSSTYGCRRKFTRSKCSTLIRPMLCTYTNNETGQRCEIEAMPCVKYCQQHITCSDDQLLFTACTAIRNDNTACKAPVLDQSAENPLCLQHKRLEFMSEKPKKILNTKTKPINKMTQPRKRSRSSTGGSSRSGRNRKRKRPHPKEKKDDTRESFTISNTLMDSIQKYKLNKQDEESNDSLRRRNALIEINPQIVTKSDIDESQEVEVGEEVLAMAADLPLELANHATRLLEEHDFTNVLNHIPADAFNDLFTEDKEEYEPTPQETEELERALEAVDNDVKSLEKLSQTQGILDALLDEQAIAQTLAQLPEVTANLEVPPTLVPVFYQNGFTNLNQIEQTLHDVNKSLTQTVLLNQGTDVINNHFTNNLTVPNHADLLQS